VSGAAGATVLVTARSFGRADPGLRGELEEAVAEVRYNELGRPLGADELREALAGVDGVIAGIDRFDEAAISAAPRVRAIARHGVGTDGVDLAAARRSGIVVTNTPGANSEAVAELAIGLMFALARRIPQQHAAAREGSWRAVQGVQLAGRTVGLLGLGRVGAGVARRAAALGCNVVGFDPAVDAGAARAIGARLATTREVAAEADFLSLHLPVTPETTGLVDAGFLAGMRPGANLVNTGRGELVVEPALLEALEGGRLAGAALDTLREEPPPAGHPLLARDDVIVTPHAGAQTAEANAAMGRLALDDLLAVLAGRAPRHPVELPDG
jgi:D-3-phosphoglycerate dehydrogenase / 2-oxoglutarate reductase